MDNLDFLEEEVAAQPEQETEPVAQEPEVAQEAPPEEVKPEPVMVPLAALHEVRDKVKHLEGELAAAKSQPEPVAVPDVFEDPEGFQAFQTSQVDMKTLSVKLDLSEDLAREKFGDDTVEAAREWALKRYEDLPGYKQKVLSQRNPYAFIVQEYQKDQLASQVNPDDWTQFQAWKAAQSAVVPAAHPQPVAAPVSIANAPSAGGVQHVAIGGQAIFDDVFKK